jgi:hypothetical protein
MSRAVVAVALVVLAAFRVLAGPNWISGNISNVTSTQEGLMIMLDTGLPDNCQGTPWGWLLIRQEHKTLIAVTLLAWTLKIPVCVYTTGIGSSGYGEIIQVDPNG